MDLNREVAEKVMEWDYDELVGRGIYGEPAYIAEDNSWVYAEKWNPSLDLNQCFEVVGEMQSKGWGVCIDNFDNSWSVTFSELGKNCRWHTEKDASLNKGILKAALEAIKDKNVGT